MILGPLQRRAAAVGVLITVIATVCLYAQAIIPAQSQSTPIEQPNQKLPIPVTVIGQVALQKDEEPKFDWSKSTCLTAQNHDQADLCEQRRMAKAAEDSVWWARLQTWIAALGFAAVVATLVFTGIAAGAAKNQVSLSRHALVSTDRAFVFPVGTTWKSRVDSNGHVTTLTVAVIWKNLGATPTRYLRWNVHHEVRNTELPPDFAFPNGALDRPLPLLLAPDRTLETSELPITLAEAMAIYSGTVRLYVWGWAEYNDVFDQTERHRTEFCYQCTIQSDPRSANGFSSRDNIYSRHNGADVEAMKPIETFSS